MLFAARGKLHCCTSWKHGPRVVFTAFTSINCRSCEPDVRTTLGSHLHIPILTDHDLDVWITQAAEMFRERERQESETPRLRQKKLEEVMKR